MITILLIVNVCVIVFKEWFMQMLMRVHCRLLVESEGWKYIILELVMVRQASAKRPSLCLAVAI